MTSRYFLNLCQKHAVRCCSNAHLSTAQVVDAKLAQQTWNANQDDPMKHDVSHLGLFYSLPEEKEILKIFGQQKIFHLRDEQPFHSTIGFVPIMIRQPAITAMETIKKLKPDEEAKRILVYGDLGHGKHHTLNHLIHYLHLCQDHLMICIDNLRWFTHSPREFAPSTSRPGRVDSPINSALVLQSFRIQNSSLLKKYEKTLVCSRDYKWSSREVTRAGDTLASVADHGVNRVIHASDCLAVIIKELMLAADQGKIKLAFVANDASSLFDEIAGMHKHPDRKTMFVDEITACRAFKKLIKGDYKNGLVVASIHDKKNRLHQKQTPESVLTEEGQEYFQGSQRIHVPKYSRQEFENCLNFYEDIGWITRPAAKTGIARDEIRFISGLNPQEVSLLCRNI